ncbi:hypothetical protein QE416_000571 [Microbacterium sp. SORGH_AS 421]|nr:hypothetical protein [Microbacterium sp. SORGH_AS_0421]
MGETDAVIVGDHDEQALRAGSDVGGVPLQQAVAQARGIRGPGIGGVGLDEVAHLGGFGDGPRDVQRRGIGLGLQLLHAEPGEDGGAHGDDGHLRGDLHDQHARGEPHPHLPPRLSCAKCAEHTVRA